MKRIKRPARINLIPFLFSLPDVTPRSPHRMEPEDSLHSGQAVASLAWRMENCSGAHSPSSFNSVSLGASLFSG